MPQKSLGLLSYKDISNNGELSKTKYLLNRNDGSYAETGIHCNMKTTSLEAVLKALEPFEMEEIYRDGRQYVYTNFERTCVVALYGLDEPKTSGRGKYIHVAYVKCSAIKSILGVLVQFKDETLDKRKQIKFIVKNGRGLELISKEIAHIVVNPETDYELSLDYSKIEQSVSGGKAGLILFSGVPGTGKSSLIRHLIQTVSKDFVYIPVDMVGVLSDANFLPFAMEELTGSTLIVEDGETVLVDRQAASNKSAVTNILNITDGILSEFLNIQILATVNVEEALDSALLRKGRMLAKAKFNPLPIEKANSVLKRLGKTEVATTEMTLAEIYNSENVGHETEKRKIGF